MKDHFLVAMAVLAVAPSFYEIHSFHLKGESDLYNSLEPLF
jgi:hypothetical protein